MPPTLFTSLQFPCYLIFPFFPTPIYRETLLGQLLGYVRSIADEFNTKSNPPKQGKPVDSAGLGAAERQAPPTGKNLPGVVNNIVWTRQLEAKVRNSSVLCILYNGHGTDMSI